MKKIAISTLIGEFNNGNRLQNYALQHLIEDNFKDVEVATIRYNPYFIKRKKTSKILKFYYYLKSFKNHKEHKEYTLEKRRTKKFKEFNKNINFDDTKYSKTNLRELNNKYDYFLCGSDQVWSGEMSHNLSTHLLEGIDNNKKISYAASLGKSKLHDYEKAMFKKHIPTFKSVSVREQESINLIQPFTNVKVESHLDPTFMLSSNDWSKVINKPKVKLNKKYIFVCMLGEQSVKFINYISELAKIYSLDVINITNKESKFYSHTGPSEFLYLIKNAEIVFTDSFHSIVFSIIFKKPFMHVPRISSISNMSVRIKNLEQVFGVNFKHFDENNLIFNETIFEFIIKNSEEIILHEKQRSLEFLKNAFEDSSSNNNLNDVLIDCSGCGLCANICPTKAITYKTNEFGFIYPVIDKTKCVNCGKCKNNCSELTYKEKLKFNNGIYALKKKIDIDEKSSTTGFFSYIAKYILDQGGVVFGAKYDKFSNKYAIATNVKDLEQLKGSKYYQMDITEIYKDIEKYLNQDKKVLVSGTPCQISGIHFRFGNNKNLLLVQVICHGVPSFELFKKLMIEEHGKMPDSVNFKKKIPNWDNYSVEYTFDKKTKIIPRTEDLYMKTFLSHKALNESCYNCKYAGRQTGADFIIGDCWGIKQINKHFYDPKGVSIMVPVSKEATKILEAVPKTYDIYTIPKRKYLKCNVNLFEPIEHSEYLNSHYDFLFNKNLIEKENDKQNLDSHVSLKLKIKKFIKRLLKI